MGEWQGVLLEALGWLNELISLQGSSWGQGCAWVGEKAQAPLCYSCMQTWWPKDSMDTRPAFRLISGGTLKHGEPTCSPWG